MVLIDSILQKEGNYYPKVFLEDFKYIIKEKKVIRYITHDLEISSDDSDKKDSDKED